MEDAAHLLLGACALLVWKVLESSRKAYVGWTLRAQGTALTRPRLPDHPPTSSLLSFVCWPEESGQGPGPVSRF